MTMTLEKMTIELSNEELKNLAKFANAFRRLTVSMRNFQHDETMDEGLRKEFKDLDNIYLDGAAYDLLKKFEPFE